MDIELLFSRNPFVQEDATRFGFVRPALSRRLTLPKDAGKLDFKLPRLGCATHSK
jgi:hypothetical protein